MTHQADLMRLPPTVRLIFCALVFAVVLVSCSGGSEEIISSSSNDTETQPSESDQNSTATSAPTPSADDSTEQEPAEEDTEEDTEQETDEDGEPALSSLPEVATPDSAAFKQLAPNLVGINEDLTSFVGSLDLLRIDELAADACSFVPSQFTDTALGERGLAAYDRLTAAEQSALAVDDWVVFYGALIGFFCPEILPEVDLDGGQAGGTALEQFRDIVTELSGVSAETESFVAGLSDERVNELQTIACASTSDAQSGEDFGAVIVDSFESDLTPEEAAAIDLAGYSELYGSIVGWFCPGNLPR